MQNDKLKCKKRQNKKKATILLLLTAYCLLLTACLYAGLFTEKNIGTTGAQMLKLSRGVRAMGMGDAYGGISDDISAMYYNPAGLNLIENYQLSAMHAIWFQNIFYNSLSLVLPTEIGVIGISMNYLGMDDIDKFYATGESAGGTYSPYDMLLYIAYANRLKGHKLGVNIKILQSVIADESAITVAADLGWLKNLNKLRIGLSVQNIGPGIKFIKEPSPLPLNIKIGASYSDFLVKGLLVASDINFPIDNTPSFHIGSEYTRNIKKISLSARAGFKTTNIKALNLLSGLSLGGGITYSGLGIDYAWAPYGKLGDTHRFSITYNFPVRTRRTKEEEFIYETKKQKESEALQEQKMEEADRRKREQIKIYSNEASALQEAGQHIEAIEIWMKVLELDPDNVEAERGLKIDLASDVFFAIGKDTLKPESKEVMENIAKMLIAFPKNNVAIEGHTDSVGSENFNQKISEKRANSVFKILTDDYGIDRARFTVKGFGELRPVANNETEAGRSKNRRVEIIILRTR